MERKESLLPSNTPELNSDRSIQDLMDELDVSIALQDFETAVSNVERGAILSR
jgi:hypothetical protein